MSIFRPSTDSIAAPQSRSILAAARRCEPALRRPLRTSLPPRCGLRYLLLALLLLAPPLNRAQPGIIRLPFHTVRSMILIEGRVNDSPALFLFDTGSTRTIVSTRVYGGVPLHLQGVGGTAQGPGIVGDSLSLAVNLELANHTWAGQRVAVMNLDGLGKFVVGVRFDGLLGQDILREFHSVRIDYKAQVVELEQ